MSAAQTNRRWWWTAFVAFFVLGGLWSFGTPLYGGPDEPAHVVKAAGVVRAQLVGDQVEGGKGFQRTMDVPAGFAIAQQSIECWRFDLIQPATCGEAVVGPSGAQAAVLTTASRHPPFYYLPVGLPTWLGAAPWVVHLMRLISVAIAAYFVAGAFDSSGRLANPLIRRLGLAATLTPSIVGWSSVVNPSGVEISAAVCLIATLLVIGSDAERADPGLLWRAGVAAAVMALSRHLAPVWLVVIVGVFAVLFGSSVISAVARRRASRGPLLLAVAAGIVQVLWVLIARPLSGIDDGTYPAVSVADAFRGALGMGERNITHLVGIFGWNNPRAPYAVEVSWLLVLGAFIVFGFAIGRRRELFALGLAIATVVALPVLFETYQASQDGGFLWQARYTAPIAVLVPLLAAHVVAAHPVGFALRESRLAGVVAAILWFGHVGSYWAAVRRFSVGTDGSWIWMIEPGWRPPLAPAVLHFLAFVVAAAIFVWVLSGGLHAALRFGKWSANPTRLSPSRPSSPL